MIKIYISSALLITFLAMHGMGADDIINIGYYSDEADKIILVRYLASKGVQNANTSMAGIQSFGVPKIFYNTIKNELESDKTTASQ